MTHFLRIAFLLLFLTFGWAKEGTSSLPGGVAESMAHYLDESSQARRTDGLADLSKHEQLVLTIFLAIINQEEGVRYTLSSFL